MKFSVFSFKFLAHSHASRSEFLKTQNSKLKTTRGFTLVEMIVAVALFSVVMLVSIGALLSLVDANRKAQALQSVINNLNIAVDGLVRAVREGSNYRCGSPAPADPDCINGGTSVYFEPYGGDPALGTDDWAYLFDTTGEKCGVNRICKSENGGTSWVSLTAPQVTIDSATFYVIGAHRTDTAQAKTMVVIKGTAGAAKVKIRTTFHVQSTAVQRMLDI